MGGKTGVGMGGLRADWFYWYCEWEASFRIGAINSRDRQIYRVSQRSIRHEGPDLKLPVDQLETRSRDLGQIVRKWLSKAAKSQVCVLEVRVVGETKSTYLMGWKVQEECRDNLHSVAQRQY